MRPPAKFLHMIIGRMLLLLTMLCISGPFPVAAETLAKEPGTIRFATFNASLNRRGQGQLARDLAGTNQQAQQVAAIIQHLAPDVLLINEFDYDAEGKSATHFIRDYLARPQHGQSAIAYEHWYHGPVNTGVPSGADLNRNASSSDPADAFGFGRFPGQYGMLVLSRYPLDTESVRTFQRFLWKDMREAQMPRIPANDEPYYNQTATDIFRLSSKSHWDVPIIVNERTIHLLAAHPTPPVFDGPEDRNGLRNQAEIQFWLDYIQNDRSRNDYIYDDAQQTGGLEPNASFVIAGDLNSDPHDGDSRHGAIVSLIADSRVNAKQTPQSMGAIAAAKQQGKANDRHVGNPAYDTADFSDGGSGNIRVDYVLPSSDLTIVNSGVFWPEAGQPGADWIKCSDHRLVWIDVKQ